MDKLISVQNVGKKYNNQYVLKNVSFEINKGDIIAFTGHNGQGKSTLLKMLGKLVKCETGEIRYASDIKICYVPEHFPKMNISAYTYIVNMAQIHGLSKIEAERKSKELFNSFFMSKMIHTPIKYLSKGSLQKVAVIQAFLVKPDVLLLDEPLSGQDSASQKYFIEHVKRLNSEGTAVVMSCHEKWLMNMLAKTVYQVENKKVEIKYDLTSRLDYTVMVFEAKELQSSDNFEVCKDFETLVVKIEKKCGMVKIFAQRDDCKKIILKMLGAGYELRRMYDENLE